MGKRVLIVDDSMYIRKLIKDTLESAGYNVVGEAENGEVAIEKAFELNPDLITLDNILPDMIGIDILKVIMEEENHPKIVMISAVGQQSVIDQGMELGASDYIVKPFTPEDLIRVMDKVA